MTRVPSLLAALWLAVGLTGAPRAASAEDGAAAGPVIRTSLEPDKAVIGERVRLLVDVLFADRMPAPPRVDVPQAPGLQVFRFESQGLTLRDTIAGAPYVGQRFEFALFPRRAGALVAPAPTVTLRNRSGAETGRVVGQPQTLAVSVPPGLDPAQPAIASTAVTLTQSWEPAAGKPLHVGDALARVVKRQADDTPALGFSALDASAPDGVRAYADPPQADDRIDRGKLIGARADRIVYVFGKAGDYALPAVSQAWWDLSAGRLRRATGEGLLVTVAAAPAPAAGDGGVRLRALGWRAIAVLALGLVAAAGLAALGIGWAKDRRRRSAADGPSEPVLFRRLTDAATRGDAAAAYRALLAWRDAAGPAGGSVSGVPSVQALEAELFAGQAPDARWSGPALIEEIGALRAALRTEARQGAPSALPPLNPVA